MEYETKAFRNFGLKEHKNHDLVSRDAVALRHRNEFENFNITRHINSNINILIAFDSFNGNKCNRFIPKTFC